MVSTTTNAPRQANPANTQTQGKPKKQGIFGKFLKKVGSWIKPNAEGKKSVTQIVDKPQWNNIENLDLSEQTKLPDGFKTPEKIEKLRLSYDADQKDGIAQDKRLTGSITPGKTVDVEFTITTQQIYKLLQFEPEKLTPPMARVITGQTIESTGLTDEALFKSLSRLDKKAGPRQLAAMDKKVKDILLNKLKKSGNKKIWSATKQLTNLLEQSNFKDEIVKVEAKRITSKDSQKALKKELDLVRKELNESSEIKGLVNDDKALAQLGTDIIQQSKNLVITRSKRGHLETNTKKLAGIRERFLIESFEKQTGKALDKRIKVDRDIIRALYKIAEDALRRLENRFEMNGTEKAKNYVRITDQNQGSKEQLLYATAKMNRHTGINLKSGTKFYLAKASD